MRQATMFLDTSGTWAQQGQEVMWISFTLCQDEALEKTQKKNLSCLVTLVVVQEQELWEPAIISRCYAVLGLVRLEVE